MAERIVIVGSGNVAEAMAVALTQAGTPPEQIFARNAETGGAIARKCGCAYAGEAAQLAPADLYIIAVSDNAVAKVAGGLDFGDAVVAHTAGSVGMDVLPAKIKNRAVFYPLQTFSKGRTVDLKPVPLMLEAETAKGRETVESVAMRLSDSVLWVDSQRRSRIHLAAVFVSNFANYMYSAGESLVAEAGVSFDILKPLITETAAKAVAAASPKLTQTGPAVRNDFQTKAMHVEMLMEKPNLKNLYINISQNIWETSKKM